MNLAETPVGYANPDYYTDAETTVRQLRADFARYYWLHEIAPHAIDELTRSEYQTRAEELAMRWGRHEDRRFRRMWESRQAAVMGWESRPDLARRNFDQLADSRRTGGLPVDDELWDALVDARRVTGHGDGAVLGSAQDADHRYPHLLPEAYTAARAGALTTLLDPEDIDPRTAVQRTLGAPRHATALATREQIDAAIAATEEALDAEERTGDLDTGYEARHMLLPRHVREAPVTYRYSDTAAWESRHIRLLRQVQDLAAEHAGVAFDGNRDADQARIARLETLRQAISDAGRDAIRAGVRYDDVERAYRLGRDGIYWSTEPSHPRLGRLAQLTEQRDHALTEAATLRAHLTNHATDPGPETATRAALPAGADLTSQTTTAGTGIADAVHAALPAGGDTDSATPPPSSQPVGDPSPEPAAEHDTGR
ncbi:hypothetical protein [Nocardia wallacei]|uniref:hypothetical protein n=1 Tax=Nocardia wallacei TaxID=480035 RepID=UPI0024541AE0|nr:hypothetical protein [Nocardia wallacei]